MLPNMVANAKTTRGPQSRNLVNKTLPSDRHPQKKQQPIFLYQTRHKQLVFDGGSYIYIYIPVVPHKAVAEVSE